MRGNLKRRFVYEDLFEQEPPVSSSSSSPPPKVVESWKLKLNGGQLLGVWLGISGMLLASFVAGLYSGRDQGIRYALNEQGREAVRMPIARTIVVPEETQAGEFDSVALTSSLNGAIKPTSVEPKNEIKQDVKYDFSNSVVTGVSGLGSSASPVSTQGSPSKGDLNKTTGAASASSPVGVYFVQIGTVKSLEEASSLVGKLDKTIFPAKVQETDISGRQYFRVLVGPFANKQVAEDQKNKLSSLGSFSTPPFVRQNP